MIITVWHCGAPENEERCNAEKPGHSASPKAKRRTASLLCYGTEIAIRCDGEGCSNEIEMKHPHRTRINAASKEGWFFRQDGKLDLCFEHLTIELIAWRDRTNPGWRGRIRRGLAEKLPSVESARRVAEASRVRYNGSSRTRPTRPEGDDHSDTADTDS